MSRKQEIFEKVLKNKYVHDEFVGFTREFLNDIQLVAPNTVIFHSTLQGTITLVTT